jgi:PHD/YefM family antitoxin component YafN of YafNO toxin-antitoxin module
MIELSQIHPVTDFVRNYKSYLTRLKETGRPEVLTVNGVPECVLVDTASFQEMQNALEQARFVRAVNEGIASMNAGAGEPASQAFRDIRKELEL